MDVKKIKLIALLGTITLGTVGCAHKPDVVRDDPLYKQDLKSKREYKSDLTAFSKLRANYFTRYMNEGYLRRKITTAAYNADYTDITETGSGTQLWSPVGNMIGGGSLGLGMGLGFAIADSLFSSSDDKAYVDASGAFLSENMGNIKIDSAEKAHDFMVKQAENQIETVARKINHNVRCIAGCDEDKARLYEFTPVEDSSFRDDFIYQPRNIYVWANMTFVMREVTDEDDKYRKMLRAFVGKDIRWETSRINGYHLIYVTAKHFNPDGTPILGKNFYPINAQNLWGTHIGRELYRMHYDNSFTYYGSIARGRRLFYNGNMYLHSTKGIIQYLVEKPVYKYTVENINL